jgi:hypothetical protein
MAIVRITDTLRNEVKNNVTKMFKAQLDKAKEWNCPVTADDIYDKIFAAWRTHMYALPREMFNYSQEFTIVKVYDLPIDYKFGLAVARPTPRIPSMPHVRSANVYYSQQYELLNDGEGTWEELYDYVTSRNARITAVTDKIKQVETGIEQVLKQTSTLAPALKACPALWDLLPEHIKEKHKQVVDRKKSSSLEGIDTTALIGAITLAKLIR